MEPDLVAGLASVGLSSSERRSSTGHPAMPTHSNLYVNNLPHDTTDEAVEALFRPHGELMSVRLVRASRVGASTKTFAFVKFATIEEALGAISALNNTAFPGSGSTTSGAEEASTSGGDADGGGLLLPLEVKFADADAGERNPELSAPPSDNLYIKNLPTTYGAEDLRALFAPHGAVIECKLLHRADSTQGGGALVRLNSVQEARDSIAALHNTRLPGAIAPLVVRFADSAEQKAKKAARMSRALDRWAALSGRPSAGSVGGGSAAGGSDWGPAPTAGSGAPGGGGGGVFGRGGGVARSIGSAGSDYGPVATDRPLYERESSIYIKYLPETADKLFLYERFAQFGAVHSVKVMLDDATGLCKGVGFVNFIDPEGAARAARAMNNALVGDRRLHVAVQIPRAPQQPPGGRR